MINQEYTIKNDVEYVPDENECDYEAGYTKNIKILPKQDGQGVTIYDKGDELLTLIFGDGIKVNNIENTIYIDINKEPELTVVVPEDLLTPDSSSED